MAIVPYIRLSRFVDKWFYSPVRHRMAVLSATAALFGLVTTGIDILFPLWVTNTLHFDAGQWAQLRSLRFAGVFVGVIALGAFSDRFGQRRIAVYCLFLLAATLSVIGLGYRQALWVLMPLLGALVSTVFVNMNTLVQMVSERRQGLANSIYRSVGAAAGILAPVAVTSLALVLNGYPLVLFVLAVLLVAAGFMLLRYPDDATARALGPLRQEMTTLISLYRVALQQRALLRFIIISQISSNCLAAIGVFAAIRFTHELGLNDQQFGLLSTIGGLLVLLATAVSGFFLDRVPLRGLHLMAALIAGAACVLMGLGDSLPLSILGLYISGISCAIIIGPTSMWVSRAAGDAAQTSAFTIHKIISALLLTLTMAIIAWLESLFGMRHVLLSSGIAAIFSALLFLLLPEPPRPARVIRKDIPPVP